MSDIIVRNVVHRGREDTVIAVIVSHEGALVLTRMPRPDGDAVDAWERAGDDLLLFIQAIVLGDLPGVRIGDPAVRPYGKYIVSTARRLSSSAKAFANFEECKPFEIERTEIRVPLDGHAQQQWDTPVIVVPHGAAVTVVHSARAPNKREARRQRKKAKK